MNVLQAFAPLAVWIMRLSLVVLLFFLNLDRVTNTQLSFSDSTFFISLFQILFAVVLFFGGALGRSSWTMFAGLILAILLIFDLASTYSGLNQGFMSEFLLLSVALFFMSNGNKT